MSFVIGIDPGKTGAMAVIDRGQLTIADCPLNPDGTLDYGKLAVLLRPFSGGHAFIEKVRGWSTDGGGRAFTFGENYGAWRSALACHQIEETLVPAQRWQKTMIGGKSFGKTKEQSLRMARLLFPQAELHLKGHHGRADAICLAEYGRRQIQWQEQAERGRSKLRRTS